MKREKVSVGDIRSILAGECKTFFVPEIRDLRTAQSMAHRTSRYEPELGVSFKTETDFDNLSIAITAIKNQ